MTDIDFEKEGPELDAPFDPMVMATSLNLG